MLSPKFSDTLNRRLKPHQFNADPADCWLYSYDNGRHRGLPDAVVFPESTQDVQHVLKACYSHKVNITPRGRGTGTPGGAVPTQGGIVISFEKMDKIIEFNPLNKNIKVQSGCINQTVQEEANKAGFFWAPDPGSAAYCTIGGNIAYNAGGPRAVKYGSTRDHVLGLTAVTGTGKIIHTGYNTTKSAAGYDLTRLLVGSEGTLAIITEAILKLTPLSTFRNSFKVFFKDIDSTITAVMKIMSQYHSPCALEFLDKTSVELITSDKKSNNTYMLLIDIDTVAAKSEILNSIKNPGLINYTLAETEFQINEIWSTRKLLSQSLKNISSKKISEDIVVPLSEISALLSFLDTLRNKFNIPIVTFGHIGNGNLHVNLLVNEYSEKTNQCLNELFEKTISLNGTLSGEHGIGIEKKTYMSKAIDQPTLQLMKNIKNVFDPKNILNPGKIFEA
jgi:D-lactate dehydrogenase